MVNTHADKTQNNKKQSDTNEGFQKHSGNESISEFVDNRPQAIAQRKLQKMAEDSPKGKQTARIQSLMAKAHSPSPVQRQGIEEEEELQMQRARIQKKENKTGLPGSLKAGMENLSGHSMDDVEVHYDSDKPAELQAHAFAQGADIHIGPGQEKHLPHELGHVVQQKEGRVKPTRQLQEKVNVNDDPGLEKEADAMGEKALSIVQEKEASGFHTKADIKAVGATQLVIQRAVLDADTILSGVPAVLAGNSLLPEGGALTLDTILFGDKTLKERIEEITTTYEAQFQGEESATAVSHNAQKVLAAFHTIGMVIARKLHMGQEGHKIAKALLASQKDRLVTALKTNTSQEEEGSNALSDADAKAALKMAEVLAGDDPVGMYVQDKTSLKKADASIRVMAADLEKTPLQVFELLRQQFESRMGSLNLADVVAGEVRAPEGSTFPLKDLYGEVSENFFNNLVDLDDEGKPRWGDSGLTKNAEPQTWEDQSRSFQLNDMNALRDCVSQDRAEEIDFNMEEGAQEEKGWGHLNERQMEYLTETEEKEGNLEEAAKGRVIAHLMTQDLSREEAVLKMNAGVKNLINWPITLTTKSQDMIDGNGDVIDTYKPFFSVHQQEKGITGFLPALETDATVKIVEDVLGRGLDYGQERKEKDEQQIGLDFPLNLEDRPAMACINHQYEVSKGPNYYGDTHFVLNPEVRNRSAFNIGTDCPERRSFYLLLDDILTKAPGSLDMVCDGTYSAQDIEVHVYGNIDLSRDIVEFHLGNPNELNDADVRDAQPGIKTKVFGNISPTAKLLQIKGMFPDKFEELKNIWIKKQKGHEKLAELIQGINREEVVSHIPEITEIDQEELAREELEVPEIAPARTGRERGIKCYITTACVKARGLGDDCEELETLRNFRDEFLLKQPDGKDLVMFYYEQAPKIVEAIDQKFDSDSVYEELYQVIQECVTAVQEERNRDAFATYARMVLKLRDQYSPDMDVPEPLLQVSRNLNQEPAPVVRA